MNRLLSCAVASLLSVSLAGCFSTPPPPTPAKTEKTKRQHGNRAARRHAKNFGTPTGLEHSSEVVDLNEVLKHGNDQNQIRACEQLGSMGLPAKGALGNLHALAEESNNPQVRSAATSAKAKIIAALKKDGAPDDAIDNMLKYRN